MVVAVEDAPTTIAPKWGGGRQQQQPRCIRRGGRGQNSVLYCRRFTANAAAATDAVAISGTATTIAATAAVATAAAAIATTAVVGD